MSLSPARQAPQPVSVDPHVWAAVRRLVDRSRSLSGLRSHGLHLIAARTWREQGRAVPDELAIQELFALGQARAAEGMLETVASILDQEIIVVKGMAIACRYPDPALRPFADLDLLVADPARAQHQLIASGFRPARDYDEEFFEGHHHLEPLELPGRETVKVEIHSRAPWVHWCPAPIFAELRARADPGPVPGVWYPDPLDHALILACHSWHSLPLRRALDFVDIAVVSETLDRRTLAERARERRVGALWATTGAVLDALLYDGLTPLPLRVWARDLAAIRECSLLERHLRLWLGPFAVRPPRAAAAEALHAFALDVRPVGGESWVQKLSRVGEGLRHPLRPIGEHDKRLGPAARRLRPRDGRSAGQTEQPAGHIR